MARVADGSRRRLTSEERAARRLSRMALVRTDSTTSRVTAFGGKDWNAVAFPVELNGREWLPSERSRWKTNDGRHGAAKAGESASSDRRCSALRSLPRRLPGLSYDERLERHRDRGFGADKSVCRRDKHEGRPALPPDDDRPRRPCARSDVRLGHDGVRRRAVGPAVDHDRHVARAARARPAAASDCDVPVLRAPGPGSRAGGGLRLQAPAEREGPGGRRASSRTSRSSRSRTTSRRRRRCWSTGPRSTRRSRG